MSNDLEMPRKKVKPLLPFMLGGCALFVAAIAGPTIDKSPYVKQTIAAPADPEAYLASQEERVDGIRSGLAKGIVWANPETKERTKFSLVYVHGFTGSRRELSPVCENVAKNLGANIFFTRLRGHGAANEAMGEAHFHDWLRDSQEAMAIGRAIGERVVVIGTSTGGTLATWLAVEQNDDLAGLVLISPNFGPFDKRSELLLLPWGPVLATIIEGETRSYAVPNELVKHAFTTSYPVKALFPMMATVNLVRNLPVQQITAPTLILTGDKENVVDVDLIKRFYKRIGSEKKNLLEIKDAGHILAGDAWHPQANALVESEIFAFIAKL